MGGGGGFSPIPIITTLIFGPQYGGLASMAMSALEGGSRSGADSGAAQAAEAQRAAQAAASADEAAAAKRRRADRQRQETALLAQSRAAQRAELAGRDALAQTLGAPVVDTQQLKEKLGQ